MRRILQFHPRGLLAIASLPLVALGLAVLAMRAYEWVRYDPAYFGATHLDRYGTAAAAASDLELAIHTGDEALAAELQGARSPAPFEQSTSTSLVMLWERRDPFVVYLYFDEMTYERHLIPFRQVRGRWVAVAPGAYYTLRAGGWRRFFLPVAIGWWILAGFVAVAARLLRGSERFRAWLLRDLVQDEPADS